MSKNLTQMAENLIADPEGFPLCSLGNHTLAALHDAIRRVSGKVVPSSETTDVRHGWFAYGTNRAVKVRRAALEQTINRTALTIRKQRAISQSQEERVALAERERPERELREALSKADPQLLRVMWDALQQYVDNQDDSGDKPVVETWVSDVERAEELIGKFDAYFASTAN